MTSVEASKKAASKEIDRCRNELGEVSKSLWNTPELRHEEKFAHDLLTEVLEKHGFKVERHYKVETAFRAEFGEADARPNIAILCEYDALPGMGHACGHNLIAEAGIGAALGVKAVLQESKTLGKVTVLGSPAEEGGGGKIDLINGGAFKDIDVAMMVHPCKLNFSEPNILAVKEYIFKLYGKAAHAAASPWEGVNALDAAVMAYQSISCLRQEMKPDCRVHGVILKGGAKCNIIPDYTELEYQIRAPTSKSLDQLINRILDCLRGAALCTGCRLEYETEAHSFYLNMINNKSMVSLFDENALHLGVDMSQGREAAKELTGSTDMGSVSYVVPSIHPMYKITESALNHTKEFTVASGDQKAQEPTIIQAKAMAHTALDIYTNPDLLTKIKNDFEEDLKNH